MSTLNICSPSRKTNRPVWDNTDHDRPHYTDDARTHPLTYHIISHSDVKTPTVNSPLPPCSLTRRPLFQLVRFCVLIRTPPSFSRSLSDSTSFVSRLSTRKRRAGKMTFIGRQRRDIRLLDSVTLPSHKYSPVMLPLAFAHACTLPLDLVRSYSLTFYLRIVGDS